MTVINTEYEQVPVAKLKRHPKNPRQGDIGAISASIERNGFYGALIVQRSTSHVLVGNHRYLAAKQLGMKAVPVIWADVDDDTALRILLADNRTNDLATYDEQELLTILSGLAREGKLDGSGYSGDDLDDLLQKLTAPSLDEMARQHGEPRADSLWPVIRVRVSPDTMALYERVMEGIPGDNDADKFPKLLELAAREDSRADARD